MKRSMPFYVCLAVACGLSLAVAGTPQGKTATTAPSTGARRVAGLPSDLREMGPAGLVQALEQYDSLQEQLNGLYEQRAGLVADYDPEAMVYRSAGTAAELERVNNDILQLQSASDACSSEIDQIGGQRGCTLSRLYWYTDWDQAAAASRESGKPILSLRLLGQLTDQYSCANSRFFRTALYSNEQISQYLRDHFILHWKTVRPVPRVTIDFGDGRVLQRTLTGNSAHYVLSSDGQPLDVLPGLYSPQQFAQWLMDMGQLHEAYLASSDAGRVDLLSQYHARQRDAILAAWDHDLAQLDAETTGRLAQRLADQRLPDRGPMTAGGEADQPNASQANRLTVSKYRESAPVMRFARLGGDRLEAAMDDSLWQALADLHRSEVKLDLASITVMRSEFPSAQLAAARAISKTAQEDPILRVVRQFEESMTLDTLRNEYLLHRAAHQWFVDCADQTTDVEQLNEWVYSQLFLTPGDDPWLGLAPADVYTALEGNGQSFSFVGQPGAPGP